MSEPCERCFLDSLCEDRKMPQCEALLSKPDSPSRKKDLYGPFRERRRRDLNRRRRDLNSGPNLQKHSKNKEVSCIVPFPGTDLCHFFNALYDFNTFHCVPTR